jgi:beta-carotene ketolase (CrtW type)
MTAARQTLVGLGFAAAVVLGWAGLFAWGVFLHRWSALDLVRAPVVVVLQSWLSVALFIVAHDAMHGSLAPRRQRLNAVAGQICVGLYAAFGFRKLRAAHGRHHTMPGTAGDPDFHSGAFLPWLRVFFVGYFGWPEFARLTAGLLACLLLGARISNLLAFWALPALLSALQLFYFGTYLPHRSRPEPFADEHRARSLRQPRWWSFLSCLHFGGYHHEHHLRPELPWWRLPQARL